MAPGALPIRLLVFDIDGVLTGGEAQALDTRLLDQLASMNRAARGDPTLPAVTLCTGRPAPYVELMLQAMDGHLPGILENGAGLYLPDGYQFLPHPDLARPNHFQNVRQRLTEGMVKSGQAYIQPGKEYTLTLFARDPANRDRLAEWAADALGDEHDAVDLVYSNLWLNVLPRGIDKGKGLDFLADKTGFKFEVMLGVGDSDVYPPFLSLVGYSAAPANAGDEIKAMVQYVAPRQATDGVRDILSHFEVA